MDKHSLTHSQAIAYRIRVDMVCCDVYARVNDTEELKFTDLPVSHSICYWGEAAARTAEGRCPGFETCPNVCQCDCQGCAHHCSAHNESHRWNPDNPAVAPPYSTRTSPAQKNVEAERDMLGRESDRLRKDWVTMRDKADRDHLCLRAVTEHLPAISLALSSLPDTCRYHKDTAPQYTRHEACCDTGIPAERKKNAQTALDELNHLTKETP